MKYQTNINNIFPFNFIWICVVVVVFSLHFSFLFACFFFSYLLLSSLHLCWFFCTVLLALLCVAELLYSNSMCLIVKNVYEWHYYSIVPKIECFRCWKCHTYIYIIIHICIWCDCVPLLVPSFSIHLVFLVI